ARVWNRGRCGRACWRGRRPAPPPSSGQTGASRPPAADRASECWAAGRHLEIFGEDDLDTVRVAFDRGPAFDRLADGLEADPAAGEARQREPIETEVEIVLQRRRIDHGDQRCREYLLALVGQRRGLAAMVVAGKREHAAIQRGTGGAGMLERIDRA